MTWGRAQAKQVELNEDAKAYNSQRLHHVLYTPVARGGVSSVSFKEPVSSTPHVRLCPTTVDLSGVSSPETSDKEIEDKVFRHYHPWVKSFEGGARPETVHPVSRTKQEKFTVAHILQLAAEEFKKIREQKISKLNGGYLANDMLVFNTQLKDITMCIQEWRLSNLEVVQLIKGLKITPAIMWGVQWNFI